MPDDLKDTILSIFEASLDAQLRAVAPASESRRNSRRRLSVKVCRKSIWPTTYLNAPAPPCTSRVIIERIQQAFGVGVDRESLVSSLTKKVARDDRFSRTEKNTFGLLPESKYDAARGLPRPHPGLARRLYPTPPPAARPAPGPGRPAGARAAPRSRASCGPMAASSAVGRRTTSCIRAPSGTLRRCSPRCLKQALSYCPGRLIGVAVDDTRMRKTGRAIPQAAYHRDPMSPPFHTNLILGLRFLQGSLLLPLASARRVFRPRHPDPLRRSLHRQEARQARRCRGLGAIPPRPQTL